MGIRLVLQSKRFGVMVAHLHRMYQQASNAAIFSAYLYPAYIVHFVCANKFLQTSNWVFTVEKKGILEKREVFQERSSKKKSGYRIKKNLF